MFYGRFHDLLPIILGGSRAIYMFESYDKKNLYFLRSMAVIMIYCSHFLGFSAFYMFPCYDEKLIFFAFYGHFHELLPTVWGSKVIYMFDRYDQKLVVFAVYGHFRDLLPRVLRL